MMHISIHLNLPVILILHLSQTPCHRMLPSYMTSIMASIIVGYGIRSHATIFQSWWMEPLFLGTNFEHCPAFFLFLVIDLGVWVGIFNLMHYFLDSLFFPFFSEEQYSFITFVISLMERYKQAMIRKMCRKKFPLQKPRWEKLN